MSAQRRFRLFADVRIQGGLCLRVVCYWVLCQVAFATMILFGVAISGLSGIPGGVELAWRLITPAVIASSLVLPIVMLDMLVYSNRFAGPLLRFRNSFRRLARGEEVAPIHFRKRDLLLDLARDFNLTRERILARQGGVQLAPNDGISGDGISEDGTSGDGARPADHERPEASLC